MWLPSMAGNQERRLSACEELLITTPISASLASCLKKLFQVLNKNKSEVGGEKKLPLGGLNCVSLRANLQVKSGINH